MRRFSWLSALLATLPGVSGAQPPNDPFCQPLLRFVESVQANQRHEFAFHTVWGSNFKDSSEPAMFAKRCTHGESGAGKSVCEFLMSNGAVEFAGANVKRALACLSPESRLAQGLELKAVSFSLAHGTQERGSLVALEFAEDPQLGGKVLRISAHGY